MSTPLKAGDSVRCHLFGEWRGDNEMAPPDLNVGIVRFATKMKDGKQFVKIYWMQAQKEYGAHITHQSGDLFKTNADNIFARLPED